MQVKAILRQFRITPKKKLGQNFLISKRHLERIAGVCALNQKDIVIEIGSGVGNLTAEIAKTAAFVYAVEKDSSLSHVLNSLYSENENIKIINEDFLETKISAFSSPGYNLPKIIGNPPYYLSTQLIEKLIKEEDLFQCAFLSLQKEYVKRMLAKPGTKSYGRLTIFVQSFLEIKSLFTLSKNLFFPIPEVDSIFVSLTPRTDIRIKSEQCLDSLTREFFQKRRKKISGIIKNSKKFSNIKMFDILSGLGIDSNLRPEELEVSDYINIANLMIE